MSLAFTVDKREMQALENTFRLAPKKMRGFIKKRWRKEGKKTVKEIKAVSLSGPTGPTTLRHRSPRERAKLRARGVRDLRGSLKVKRLKFGVRGSFGGYMVIGTKGVPGSRYDAHPLLNIYEFQRGGPRFRKGRGRSGAGGGYTGRLETSKPLEAGWKKSRGELDIARATSEGIDDYIKSDWRGK
jgi:hypothetical protein